MMWFGETEKQRTYRLSSIGEPVFAFFPTQMKDGMWVWLQKYWRYMVPLPNGVFKWSNGIDAQSAQPTRWHSAPPSK